MIGKQPDSQIQRTSGVDVWAKSNVHTINPIFELHLQAKHKISCWFVLLL